MIIVIQAKTQAYRCQISALDTSATDIEEQEDFMDVTTNVKNHCDHCVQLWKLSAILIFNNKKNEAWICNYFV